MKNTLFRIGVAGLKNDGSQAGYPALFCAGFKHVIFRAGFNLLGTSMLILPAGLLGLLGVTHLLVQSTAISKLCDVCTLEKVQYSVWNHVNRNNRIQKNGKTIGSKASDSKH